MPGMGRAAYRAGNSAQNRERSIKTKKPPTGSTGELLEPDRGQIDFKGQRYALAAGVTVVTASVSLSSKPNGTPSI